MDLLAQLGTILPEDRVVFAGDDLQHHGGAIFTYHTPVEPDAVVYPQSRDEVVEILRFANEHRIPIVPLGQESSLEAHTFPVHGGISLDLGRMDRILEIRPDDFIARVQPGLTHGAERGVQPGTGSLPGDPGWDACSAGWRAPTRAVERRQVRRQDQVLGLEAVLGDATVMRTGGMAMKSSAGYNLTGLFVGFRGDPGCSDGTDPAPLPAPGACRGQPGGLPDIESAGRAAVATIRPARIGRVELVDARTVEAVNAYRGTD